MSESKDIQEGGQLIHMFQGMLEQMEKRILERMGTMENKMQTIEEKIESLATKDDLGILRERIEDLEVKVATKLDIEALEQELVSKTEFADFQRLNEKGYEELEKRVAVFENRLPEPDLEEIAAKVQASFAEKFCTKEEIEKKQKEDKEIEKENQFKIIAARQEARMEFLKLRSQVQDMVQSELKTKSPVAAVSFDLPSENIDLLNWNLIGLGGVDSSTPISNMRKKDPGKPSDSDPEANLVGLSPSPCQFFGLSSSPSSFSPSFAESRAWSGIAVPDPRAPTTERGKVAPDLRARACSGIGAPDLRAPTTERGKVAPDPRARAPDRRSPSMGSPDLGMKSPRSSPDDDDNLMDLSMEAPGSRRSRGCREGRYTVMVPQTELKPNQTLHQVNPRSVKWLLNEVYPAYKRTSIDRSLNLVDFLSPEVTKQLITRAKRKWRGLLWHMPDESIPNQLSDQNVKEVL